MDPFRHQEGWSWQLRLQSFIKQTVATEMAKVELFGSDDVWKLKVGELGFFIFEETYELPPGAGTDEIDRCQVCKAW